MSQRIIVVGATGAIGRPLCGELIRRGHQVTVFSRDAARAHDSVPGADAFVTWTPDSLSEDCRSHLRSADAVVYLAGAALFDGRRHDRAEVEAESRARIGGIDTLVTALVGTTVSVLVSASSVGYYGYVGRSDQDFDETSSQGADWWGRDSAAIEAAALAAADQGVRTVVVRTGYVLTHESLTSQVAQFDHHFGGWIGWGRGWTPWIHLADEVGLIISALEQPVYAGPLNATAPEPLRNRAFARTLGRTLDRHAWMPVPTPFARMGLGVLTDIIVKGKRVIPSQALANNYRFQFDKLEDALRDLLGSPKPK